MLVDARASSTVFVGGTAGRLHHEHICAAHVLLNLHVGLAIGKADHLRLPALHPKKLTHFVSQRLVRGPAEDLELLVHPRSRLAIWLLVRQRWTVLFHL